MQKCLDVEMSRSFHDDPRILDGTILTKLYFSGSMQMQPAPHAPADTLGVRPQTTAGLVSNSLLEKYGIF